MPKTYKGAIFFDFFFFTFVLLLTMFLGCVEAMLWLEGKRALELGAEIRGPRTK